MKEVAVLLSSYNGDAYIEEQIASIMNQDYPNCRLYIRDDGSNGKFTDKLRELQNRYDFELYLGENFGFLKSFFWLLQQIPDADYYAFSDQDDIWLPNKISDAVRWLEDNEAELPLLYHGAYEIQDSAGRNKGCFIYPDNGYDFRRSITENHYSGFAMVINRTMRARMLEADADRIMYHDWWAANIALGLGKAHFSSTVCAVHRAHEHNVTRITLGRRIAWFFDTLKKESEIHCRMLEFERLFKPQLSPQNQRILNWFTDRRYHLVHAVVKCFYPKRWRPVMGSEISMRILMLLGKI